MKCKKCNTELGPQSFFCPNCGEENKKGTLTVTRLKKTMGFAMQFSVYIDGEQKENLKNNSSVTYDLPLGKHIVLIKSIENSVEEEITLTEENKDAEIKVFARMGVLAARVILNEVVYK